MPSNECTWITSRLLSWPERRFEKSRLLRARSISRWGLSFLGERENAKQRVCRAYRPMRHLPQMTEPKFKS